MSFKKTIEVEFPKDWNQRCAKDEKWCTQLIDKLGKALKVTIKWGKLPKPLYHYIKNIVKKNCKTVEKELDCEVNTYKLMNQLPCKLEVSHDRSANKGTEKSVSPVVWLSLGGLLLIILLGVIVASWYRLGSQKSVRAAKGTSKSCKSKLGKSRIGSRKSSKPSSRKGSHRSKGNKSVKKK